MEQQREYETEHIVLNYFRHLKLYKYFLRSDAPTKHCRDYQLLDISAILNNMNLSELEQSTLVYYGYQMHAPRKHSRYRTIWENTIKHIADEFKKHGVIQ